MFKSSIILKSRGHGGGEGIRIWIHCADQSDSREWPVSPRVAMRSERQ